MSLVKILDLTRSYLVKIQISQNNRPTQAAARVTKRN